MLAHLLGDGSFVRRQPIRYASVDEDNLAAVTEAAKHFGITAIRDEYAAARVTTLRLPAPFRLARGRRNPIAEWLDGLGSVRAALAREVRAGRRSSALPKAQIALFLRHLWATDGSVTVTGWPRRADLLRVDQPPAAATASRGCCCGSGSRLGSGRSTPGSHRPQYTLDISGRDDQLRFLREIGVHGERGAVVLQRSLADPGRR